VAQVRAVSKAVHAKRVLWNSLRSALLTPLTRAAAGVRRQPPVNPKRILPMHSFYLPDWLVPSSVLYSTTSIRCRYGYMRKNLGVTYHVMVKVPNGVRYLLDVHPVAPSIALMTETCLSKGKLFPRPYYLAQEADACSELCVIALFCDLCRRSDIDALDLLARIYPQWKWSDHLLEEVREDADWQGVQYPNAWTDDAISGLTVSIYAHFPVQFLRALLAAMRPRSSSS
jgi:hypothetical protein